jgi:hypothetical protein
MMHGVGFSAEEISKEHVDLYREIREVQSLSSSIQWLDEWRIKRRGYDLYTLGWPRGKDIRVSDFVTRLRASDIRELTAQAHREDILTNLLRTYPSFDSAYLNQKES